MNEHEKKIKKYLDNVGILFLVVMSDKLRVKPDCYIVQTTRETYYVDGDGFIHSEYPPTEDNIIIDDLFYYYIKDVIGKYNQRTEHSLEQSKKMLNLIK